MNKLFIILLLLFHMTLIYTREMIRHYNQILDDD